MTKILIIGGSYAGLKAVSAIYNLKRSDLEVTLVSPSTHAYFNVAAPRLLVEPSKFDETIISVEEIVKSCSKETATFIQGFVTDVNLQKCEASVRTVAGKVSIVHYDVLIISSGTEAKWAGYKVNDSAEKAKAAIFQMNESLHSAKSVAIIGGGPTGVESAGEISARFPLVKVTLYSGTSEPLMGAAPNLSGKATIMLQNLGVEIVNNARVKSVKHKRETGALMCSVVLENGQVRNHDVVLESYIKQPYSSFLPLSVKDKDGFVNTNSDLVVKGHSNTIALGDIVSGSSKSIVDLKFGQAAIFGRTLQKILGGAYNADHGNGPQNVNVPDSHYVPVTHTLLVPISRGGGVGMLYWVPLPSFLVWLGKARTYMIGKVKSQFV